MYIDPCDPCEYLVWGQDEETEQIFHQCNRPENGVCWIEEWYDERRRRKDEQKD